MISPQEIANDITWRRHPTPCRAHQEMLISGLSTGTWICAVTHPTALRPYYIVMPDGRELERKFARLEDAKPAALNAWLDDHMAAQNAVEREIRAS